MNRPESILAFAIVLALLAAAAQPVAVAAAQPKVQISSVSVSPEEPTTGERVTLETEIANLESSTEPIDVASVYVRTDGSAESHGRINNVGSIGPGGSISVPLTATFDRAGEKTLTVHAVIDSDAGRETYEYPVALDVADATVEADLSVGSPVNRSDVTEVNLTNYGNVGLESVAVEAAVDGTVVDRKPVRDVAPDASERARFDTETVAGENVTFTAVYAAAGDDHETSVTESVSPRVDGEIRLTGVETTRTGSGLTIRGDAANVGSTDADSVLVSVPEGDEFAPVSPSGEYFVGSVDASEFATFELTASLESNRTSVPVEVTYLVDGERTTTTQQVDVAATPAVSSESENQPEAAAERRSGGSSGLLGGSGPLIVVLLVVVAGAGYYVRYRR